MVMGSSTETAGGSVLTNVDHGDTPVDAGQVGDDVFEHRHEVFVGGVPVSTGVSPGKPHSDHDPS